MSAPSTIMVLVLLLILEGRTAGGHGLLEALPRIYQVTPDIPDPRRATQQKEVRPLRPTASKRVSSPPGRDHLHSVGHHRQAEIQAASLKAEVRFCCAGGVGPVSRPRRSP